MDAFVNSFLSYIAPPLLIGTAIAVVISVVYWLVATHAVDKIKHPEEWGSKGEAGERTAYLQLASLTGASKEQLFRNVYVPTKDDDSTAEIDLLILSRKGLLVFECKNYSGHVYGDGKRNKWIQYIGNQKNYFLSPVVQNRGHVRRLRQYFADIPDLPIVPFTITTRRATWKLRNIDPADHVLGWTGQHLKDVYRQLPDYPAMALHYSSISHRPRKLERPDQSIRQQHIDDIMRRNYRNR